MAVTISEFDDFPHQRAALRAAFLAGYARERTLPTHFDQHIATFLAMRHVDLITWMLSWNDPFNNPRVAPFLQQQLAALQRLLGD